MLVCVYIFKKFKKGVLSTTVSTLPGKRRGGRLENFTRQQILRTGWWWTSYGLKKSQLAVSDTTNRNADMSVLDRSGSTIQTHTTFRLTLIRPIIIIVSYHLLRTFNRTGSNL